MNVSDDGYVGLSPFSLLNCVCSGKRRDNRQNSVYSFDAKTNHDQER